MWNVRMNNTMNNWIDVNTKLPEEDEYVLVIYNGGNWEENESKEGKHNCVVAKLVKGISIEERNILKENLAPRGNIHMREDQCSNNPTSYCWETFGPLNMFGHEVSYWMPIPPLPLGLEASSF
jgi:hypothetical protein